MAKVAEQPEVRFWRLVEKSPEPNGCWLWTAAVRSRRYGIFSIRKGLNVAAHHFSYELHHGTIPDGLFVLHSCDNPRCVNPSHLRAGTQSENLRDCLSRGRHVTQTDPMKMGRPGETNGKAILTDDIVRQMRQLKAEGLRNRQIARRFGLRDCHVWQIVNRQTWKHVK